MVYLYDACDQISDFCHQQLLRKISWTDRRDRGKTVYPSPPSGSRGIMNSTTFIKIIWYLNSDLVEIVEQDHISSQNIPWKIISNLNILINFQLRTFSPTWVYYVNNQHWEEN